MIFPVHDGLSDLWIRSLDDYIDKFVNPVSTFSFPLADVHNGYISPDYGE